MPGIEVEERHQEVEAHRRDCADNEVREDVVAKLISAICFLEGVLSELFDDDIEGGEGGIGHDDTVCDDCAEVEFLCSLRTIAHAEDEL